MMNTTIPLHVECSCRIRIIGGYFVCIIMHYLSEQLVLALKRVYM